MKRRVLSLITTLALCLNLCPVWASAADEGTGDGLCPHHQAHTEECGYVQDDSGALCMFVCKICLINELISELPDSASMVSSEQMEAQLSEIYDLYNELTEDEQQQVNLSPCVSLLSQEDEADAGTEFGSTTKDYTYLPDSDKTFPNTHIIPVTAVIDTGKYTLRWTESAAIQVTGTGTLYFKGKIMSLAGIGVEVESGGFLSVEGPGTNIVGSPHALDIAHGAKVHLSGGTFTGTNYDTEPGVAIWIEDGTDADYAALLDPGYAYFDSSGNAISPTAVAQQVTVVVGQCTNHSDKSYTTNSGTPTHTWTCPACRTVEESEKCTFATFDDEGKGVCELCKNEITITVDQDSLKVLAYDETVKPASGSVSITVKGATEALIPDTDYAVSYSTRSNIGSTDVTVTVTVDGMAYNGSFTESYTFTEAALQRPVLEWANKTATVTYTGKPVEKTSLPNVTIHMTPNDGLGQYLQYSHRKQGETAYTNGLPTNAGTYDVVVSLPEMEGVYAVSSEPITLIIEKATPVSEVPEAKTLTYNCEAQQLVTAGVLKPGAVAEGALIEFASAQGGPYSTDIPTGIGVSSYSIYYRVAGTENYSEVSETLIKNPDTKYSSARINHRELKPTVELSYYTTVYTGGDKEPVVTVKDGEAVIPNSEYAVAYSNNRNVGTATVTVSNASNGNYKITSATATFKITKQPQAALSIDSKPNTIIYGDKFTLSTQGGSGDGDVTWKITAGNDVATVGEHSGQVTIIGHGSATVKATKSATDPETGVTNYETATASWTFTADKKSVVAVVTAEDKTFDGNNEAVIRAVVEQGVLSKDEVKISGLTGTFDNENAGTNKTVNVTIPASATITGTNSSHYAVTYSGTTVKATIQKKTITPTVELDKNSYDDYDGSEKKPKVTVKVGEDVIPESNYTVTYSDNVNAGSAKVTVRAKADGNYAFEDITKSFTISGEPAKVLTAPKAAGNPLIYSTFAQELVLPGTASGGTMVYSTDSTNFKEQIPTGTGAGEYTVYYKVKGDLYHTDSAVGSVKVTIAPKPVKDPTIELRDNGEAPLVDCTYDGGAKEPKVVVKDGSTLIGSGEYDITYRNNIDVGTASIIVASKAGSNYQIYAVVKFEIVKAAAKFTTEPRAKNELVYMGKAQNLIEEGTAEGGIAAYSLDGTSYNYTVPTGTDAGKYIFWYKVLADENHKDSKPVKMEVKIGPNTGTPQVVCRPSNFSYDSTEKNLEVIVLDSVGRKIPEGEYTVELPSPRTNPGSYTVTVKDNEGGNYEFAVPVTGTFEILEAGQNPLSIVTETPYYVLCGDTFRLSAIGGSGTGAIHWSIEEESNVADINQNGLVNVIGAGGFTVKAYREASDGFSKSNEDAVPFYANPKPVTAVAEAESRPYNATRTTDVTVTVPELNQTIRVTGTFDDENVGTDKTVTIVYGDQKLTPSNYLITWPDTATASIYKGIAVLDPSPAAADLHYTGGQQSLVTPGITNIGTIVYSTSENGNYSEHIPTGSKIGTYTVWYKVEGSENYTGIDPKEIEVKIGKGNPEIVTYPTASDITAGQPLSASTLSGGQGSVDGSFAWAEEGDVPVSGTEYYDVIFTPVDTDHYNTVTIQISVTVSADNSNPVGDDAPEMNYTPVTNMPSMASTPANAAGTLSTASAPMKTTVRNGTASTVLNTANGSKLVEEAVANQSQNVVIKPEITGNVSRAEVSIPASTVRQIESETNAALTVSTPIADVTLPSAALSTLSSVGGTVDVVTEQVERGVSLKLTAGGKNVESVPGGLTLTVPVEDATPGTVAVLVSEDGTRETIRKSIVEDDTMSIPLSGSATVEIVDNSKDFTDVPSTSWASDAVAFASAHELFNGTSETTFSPDQPMSRGMLATVLYNLEGRPEQELTGEFSDVSSDAWYADGVSWATANGITNGYGNGQFGPDDNVTREQFVVMLWKYAGSPEASGEGIDFTDADQASSYAREALSWAVENGILNGYGNGQLDPGGMVTRAQAAQMLKNLMENT